MKHHIAAAVLSVVSITAFAQSNGLPPSQPPAGSPEKFMKPSRVSQAKANSDNVPSVRKASTKEERRAGRRAARDARVGPKPLN